MPFRSRQLEYFITVAEEGQITRAAAKLHMAQPALSQAMTQLEAEMGVKLLERHPRGVSLTPAGELFYPKARAVVEREAEATQAASLLRRASSGTIELGFIGPPPTLSAPELLATLSALHADAESHCATSASLARPTSWLKESGVDAVFCHLPAAEEGVHIQPGGSSGARWWRTSATPWRVATRSASRRCSTRSSSATTLTFSPSGAPSTAWTATGAARP